MDKYLLSFGHRGLRYEFLREKKLDRSIDLAVCHVGHSSPISAFSLVQTLDSKEFKSYAIFKIQGPMISQDVIVNADAWPD